MNQLTKSSSSEEIKMYFNAILKLQSSNEEFPINLDEVWMLVYSRRDKAVNSLKENFIEGEDFKSVHQKVDGSRFTGSDYLLSLSCLEYFIARKVRPVFEVYRQVFHKTTSLKKVAVDSNDSDFDIMAKAVMIAQRQIEAKDKQVKDLSFQNDLLEKENTENRPKVEFATSIMRSDDCISIAEMAQILKQNKLAKMGQNKFFDWLRCSDYIISRGGRRNLPSQKSINLGVMRIAECVSDERHGVTINRKAVITPQGQAYFIDLFKRLSGKEYRLFSR